MKYISKPIAIPSNEILNKNPNREWSKISLTVTFNRTLPDLRPILNKYFHILQTEPKLKEIFKNSPVVPLKETKISVTLFEVINF